MTVFARVLTRILLNYLASQRHVKASGLRYVGARLVCSKARTFQRVLRCSSPSTRCLRPLLYKKIEGNECSKDISGLWVTKKGTYVIHRTFTPPRRRPARLLHPHHCQRRHGCWTSPSALVKSSDSVPLPAPQRALRPPGSAVLTPRTRGPTCRGNGYERIM